MLEMIRRIFKIAGRSRQKIIVGITFNILKSFFNGFMMFGVFWILLHLENLTPAIILQAFGVVLGSVLGRFFFQWMYDRTMSGTGYDIFRDYRLEIGEKLKQAPMGYFSEQNLGTIHTMLTTTIADLEGYSMLAIEQMTSGVAMAVLMSIMMFFFSPTIAILSIIGLLLGLLVLRWIRSRAAQYAPIYQEAQENLVNKTMEYIRGISVLRSFSKGEEGQREVRGAFQKKWDADYGQEKATSGVLRFYILVYKLMSCVLIAVAALLFMAGEISLPYCLTFLFCAFTVYSDLETMGNSAFLSKKINTELDRLKEVTNIPQMDTSIDRLEISHYDIALDHISFGYGKRQVIHGISLNIPEHTTCAIVGPSGSGKTTLCNLIARFWDVQEGVVRIGGKDVKNYTADSILEHIHGKVGDFLSLGLRHVKDRYHLKGRYRDFLFLRYQLSVCTDYGLLRCRVDFLHFLLDFERGRGKDFDTLFAFHYVSLKVVFPSVKACNQRSVWLLHGNQQCIVKTVIMEF